MTTAAANALTHDVPDHCLHASIETNGPVSSSVFEAVGGLSMVFLVVLAFVAVAFLAAFALDADVFAMVDGCFEFCFRRKLTHYFSPHDSKASRQSSLVIT